MLLQKVIINEKFLTPGSASGTYGDSTTLAVSSFQKKYGIVYFGTPQTTGFGNVGPKTRTFINQLISQGKYPSLGVCLTQTPVALILPVPNITTLTYAPTPTYSTATPSYLFTHNLTLTSTGPDVKALKVFLNSKGFTVSKSGVDSSGYESSYFGPATKSALIRFQEYYAKDILAPSGLTKGTGFFGVVTRGKVNGMGK